MHGLDQLPARTRACAPTDRLTHARSRRPPTSIECTVDHAAWRMRSCGCFRRPADCPLTRSMIYRATRSTAHRETRSTVDRRVKVTAKQTEAHTARAARRLVLRRLGSQHRIGLNQIRQSNPAAATSNERPTWFVQVRPNPSRQRSASSRLPRLLLTAAWRTERPSTRRLAAPRTAFDDAIPLGRPTVDTPHAELSVRHARPCDRLTDRQNDAP